MKRLRKTPQNEILDMRFIEKHLWRDPMVIEWTGTLPEDLVAMGRTGVSLSLHSTFSASPKDSTFYPSMMLHSRAVAWMSSSLSVVFWSESDTRERGVLLVRLQKQHWLSLLCATV